MKDVKDNMDWSAEAHDKAHQAIMRTDLGRHSISEQIRRYRRQIAEQLQGLMDDGELRPGQTLSEVLAILRK